MGPAAEEDVRTALARPGFFPGEPGAAIVRETHISWVFLTRERAYKLKKPIVLPFLDYGTRERRLELCRDEVRLNRRLAPGVYLGVLGIAATPDGGYELADADDPRAVEHVVEMRRFDEGDTMAARLSRGELDARQVAAAGRTLARFHDEAAPVAARGTRALAVERRVAADVHDLLDVVEQRGEIERVLALERFAHQFTVARAPTLEARARRGLIREGHGDLRAEHVLLEDGRVEIVDCVEFDRSLRELDVADDLAFLVMDLTAHAGAGAAHELVAAYRAAGGDPGDDALIAFYAASRALVRAKVALLRAAQLPPGSAERGHESAAARELIALAERFAWRARLPLAIVVCGVPASGKTHLATALAGASGLAHLSTDVTRKRLAGLAPHDRAGLEAYGTVASGATYRELGRHAAAEACGHGGVVVDGTFRHRDDRAAFAAGFAAAAPLVFVECRAPDAELERRARERDADPARISDATLDVVLRERHVWDPLDEVGADAHLVVRSDRPAEEIVAELLGLLDRRIRRVPAAPGPVDLHAHDDGGDRDG